MYCVLLQFNSTVQTPLHDSTTLLSTPLHSAFYPIPILMSRIECFWYSEDVRDGVYGYSEDVRDGVYGYSEDVRCVVFLGKTRKKTSTLPLKGST